MFTVVFIIVYVIIFCNLSLPDVFISIPMRQVKLALQLCLGKNWVAGKWYKPFISADITIRE